MNGIEVLSFAERNRRMLQEARAQLQQSDQTIVEMKRLDQEIKEELPRLAAKE